MTAFIRHMQNRVREHEPEPTTLNLSKLPDFREALSIAIHAGQGPKIAREVGSSTGQLIKETQGVFTLCRSARSRTLSCLKNLKLDY